jgi:hypothetical protein
MARRESIGGFPPMPKNPIAAFLYAMLLIAMAPLWIVGYGPFFLIGWLLKRHLDKHPPRCLCGSVAYGSPAARELHGSTVCDKCEAQCEAEWQEKRKNPDLGLKVAWQRAARREGKPLPTTDEDFAKCREGRW